MIKGPKNSRRGGRVEGFCFNGRGIRKRAILNPPILTRFTSAFSLMMDQLLVCHTPHRHIAYCTHTHTKIYICEHIHMQSYGEGKQDILRNFGAVM